MSSESWRRYRANLERFLEDDSWEQQAMRWHPKVQEPRHEGVVLGTQVREAPESIWAHEMTEFGWAIRPARD